MNYKIYQGLSLIATLFTHFSFSSIMAMGAISPYIASYLYHNGNKDIKVADLSILYPIMLTFENLGLIAFSTKLNNLIPKKVSQICSILLFCSVVFVNSFFASYYAYILLYGVVAGFCIGVPYMNVIKNGYAYLPTRKGLVGGVSMCAYGIGPVLYNLVFMKLVNPNDEQADQNHIFPIDVANNVPSTMRYMCAIYLFFGSIAFLCFIPKENLLEKIRKSKDIQSQQFLESINSDGLSLKSDKSEKSEKSVKRQFSIFDRIKEKTFWKLFFIGYCSMPFGLFLATSYKQYGQTITNNDQYLTILGSVGAFSNTLGRLFWNYLFDFKSFRFIMLALNTCLLFSCLSLLFFFNDIYYFGIVVLVYMTEGPAFGIFPTQAVRIFGQDQGPKLYPYIFVCFSLASITQFVLHSILISAFADKGFKYCFIIYAVIQCGGLISAGFFRFQYKRAQKQLTHIKLAKDQIDQQKNQEKQQKQAKQEKY